MRAMDTKKTRDAIPDALSPCPAGGVRLLGPAGAAADSCLRARAFSDIANMLFALRKPIDALEEVVDDKLWPLPKYRELLFIS